MWRRVVTVVLLALLGMVWLFSTSTDDVTQAQLAPKQVENDNATYVGVRKIINDDNFIAETATGLVGLILLGMWGLPLLMKTSKRKNELLALSGVLMLPVLVSACGPAKKEKVINIEPNQTAFVVPLTGDSTSQLQFQSVEFLQDKQVAAKQIIIPQRKQSTGRGYWSYDWIPTVAVIIVDRTPVTREWTQADSTGTSKSNQAFGVESIESIDFKVGATCSALVEEAHAAEFLYYFSGKSLAQVMDENVRGFIQAELFREFGHRTLLEGQGQKSDIFELVFANTQAHFVELGITINSCGGSEGLIYTDPAVQAEINENFAIQQEANRASARATAQGIENERIIAEANAYATATVVAGQAQAQVLQDTGRELSDNPGIIQYEIARRSTGEVPGILIINGDQVEQLPFSFFLSPEEWAQYGVDVTATP
jgi:hypothetical protein